MVKLCIGRVFYALFFYKPRKQRAAHFQSFINGSITEIMLYLETAHSLTAIYLLTILFCYEEKLYPLSFIHCLLPDFL